MVRFEPQRVQQGAKNKPDRWQKNPTGFFDSGHAMTGKDMSFVPLNPRNHSIVVDHNENNPIYFKLNLDVVTKVVLWVVIFILI